MKISILTICYNSEAYIERAVQSVLQQDYKDWEHIVVDGGSTDGTVAILKKHEHLKWISEPDKGQSDAMNKAFALSTGDIISYLNSDDYYNENIFGEVVSYFNRSEQPEIVIGKLKICINDSVIYRNAIDRYKDIAHFWLHRFPANPVCYFYKRDIQQEVGKFPIDNHFTMDYWFLLRAFKNRRIFKTNTEFGVFDLHADSKTGNSNVDENLKKEYFTYAITLPLLERFIFLAPWYKTQLSSKKIIKRINNKIRVMRRRVLKH